MTPYYDPPAQPKAPDKEALREAMLALIPTEERTEFARIFFAAIERFEFRGDPVQARAHLVALSKAIEIWQRQDGAES